MKLLIVTGLSGAGKSKAVEMLEDIGFACIDNMPPQLLPAFGQLVLKTEETDLKTAVVVDSRAKKFQDTIEALDQLKDMGVDCRILFLDADDAVLIRRFKETRRRHPLSAEFDSVEDAIAAERKLTRAIRDRADFTIDTSHMAPKQLKERIANIFLGSVQDALQVQCMSFGFKYGIPADADLVFDVRCLPNPYYIPELKNLTGLDQEVHDYVMQFPESTAFLQKLMDLLDFTIPLYAKEGKSELVLAFGCTGGKHRSVTFAQEVYQHLASTKNSATVTHRDIQK